MTVRDPSAPGSAGRDEPGSAPARRFSAAGARQRALLASDADRETYASILEAAYADGRLDADALELRSGTLWAATTMGELDDVVADLVRPDTPAPPRHDAAVPAPVVTSPGATTRAGRAGLLGVAAVLLVIAVVVLVALTRGDGGGGGDGPEVAGPAGTDMFTAAGMQTVVDDLVAAAGTTEFEQIGFYGDYAVASVLGAPGGDRMATLGWRDGEVEVNPAAAAPDDIEDLLFDPTADIELAPLATLARGAPEQTGVTDAGSVYLFVNRVAYSGDHEIEARVTVSNDYQTGSVVADHAGAVISADGPGIEAQPSRFLVAAGLEDAIDAVTTRIGGPQVLQLLCYGEYVSVQAPPEPGAPVVASFSYRGGPTAILDATVPSQPDRLDTALFSLEDLDVDVLATLAAEAPQRIGIDDVQSTYIYVQRSTSRRAAPVEISVYVTGRFDSGRVVADVSGQVLEVY